eukprot:31010-Pelagococcus_subviridis.AAC.13
MDAAFDPCGVAVIDAALELSFFCSDLIDDATDARDGGRDAVAGLESRFVGLAADAADAGREDARLEDARSGVFGGDAIDSRALSARAGAPPPTSER